MLGDACFELVTNIKIEMDKVVLHLVEIGRVRGLVRVEILPGFRLRPVEKLQIRNFLVLDVVMIEGKAEQVDARRDVLVDGEVEPVGQPAT